MTTRILTTAAVLTFCAATLVPSTASADPKRGQREKMLVQNPEERYVRVTGSHIPQKIQLRSIGTTTPYNLRIYTRRELESRGTGTVAGGLAMDPSIRIQGNY